MTAIGRVAVLGAGAWGSALALAAARAGRAVTLWGRDPAAMARAADTRETPRLPGAKMPPAVTLTADPGALDGAGLVILATPAQSFAETARLLPRGGVVIHASKGLDRTTGRRLSELLSAARGGPVGVLSGPSFAADVGAGLPTAVTLAHPDEAAGMAAAAALASPGFRPYWTADVAGVELGGALKNVLAIAAGIVVGRGLGESARAATIARGFAEMTRIGVALGGRPGTFAGLSGLGDLVLTATSGQSRNASFGLALGRGEPAAAALERIGTVEGVATAAAAAELAARLKLDAPLTAEVARVVSGEDSIEVAIERLLRRPLKSEG